MPKTCTAHLGREVLPEYTLALIVDINVDEIGSGDDDPQPSRKVHKDRFAVVARPR